MSENKEYIEDINNYYEEFIRLYDNKSLEMLWRKEGFSLALDETCLSEEIEKEKFLEFMFDFLQDLQSHASSNKIEEVVLEEYIEQMVKKDKYILEEIIIKTKSNLNTLDTMNMEKVVRVYNGEKKITSCTLRLEYLEPLTQEDSKKVLTLELSKQDIQKLIIDLQNICNKWEE